MRESERKAFLCQLVLRMKVELHAPISLERLTHPPPSLSTALMCAGRVYAAQARLFAAKEVPPPKRLYFITSGTVLHKPVGGTQETLGPGMTWGAADVLSLRPSLPSAVAVGFVQVQCIGREELMQLKLSHHRPFMLMWTWTIFREAGKYLITALGKLPPAVKRNHVGKKLGLRGGFTDISRAVLTLDGVITSGVRFPGDKRLLAPRALSGEIGGEITGQISGEIARDQGINAADLPVGTILDVDETIGGVIKVQTAGGARAELPNPRALPWELMEEDEEGPGWPTSSRLTSRETPRGFAGFGSKQKRGLGGWKKEEIDATSIEDLTKLKKAVEAAIEEKHTRATRHLEDMLRETRAVNKTKQRSLAA